MIGDEQSAFIKNRSILDGVVILNKVIDDAKKSKTSSLLFKVDFTKAYDSINCEPFRDDEDF